ncbi:MAG: hypothetical protein QF464_01675 [Myxococcota bacterium]|nr:hypothetical protein [Myxococcota bacterium]
MHIPRTALGVAALLLTACPPPLPPDGDTPDAPDAVTTEVVEPLGFGPCESGLDCATYPNSASICDHLECALQCIPGFANCDRELPNGCEQSLSTSEHCGGCNTPCAPYKAFGTCAGEACTIAACNLGFGDCDGELHNGCESLLVTPTDCGGCGVPCAPPNAEPTCDAGECAVASCLPGFGDCDGAVDNGCEATVDTRLRCGDCDTKCAPGQGCAPSVQSAEVEPEGDLPDIHHCSPVMGTATELPVPAAGLAVASDGVVYTIFTATEDVPWAQETLTVAGPSDAVLMRHGDAGWAQVIGGLNTDAAAAVAVDAEDHVIFTGVFQSGAKLGGGLLPHTGGADVFIASYEATGELRWGLGAGGLGDDAPTGLAVGADGAFVVVGTAWPPASFGGDALMGHEGVPIGFVARYGSSGAASWSVSVAGEEAVETVDVAIGPEGEVHVLVVAPSPVAVDGVEVAPAGISVLTWLSDGTFDAVQGVALEVAKALAAAPSGDLFVAGDDPDGAGQIVRLGEGPTPSIAVPGITDLIAGDGLYAVGHTSGAFDVGLGPVIVDGVLAARYDPETGDPIWFLGLDDPGHHPRVARGAQGVVVAAEQITPLDE